MPQEHLTTVLTVLFAPTEAATPQTNPIIVYGAVFVLLGAVAFALWAARPFRRGLGQKPLTPRPDGADGLPWMPGGDIFESADQPAPTYQPDPTYQPLAGAPQFSDPPALSAPLQTRPAPPRKPWSSS